MYSASGDGDIYKTYFVKIGSKSIEHLRECDYSPSVHSCQRLPANPTFLAHTNWFVYGKPTVVDSTIYVLALENVYSATKDQFELLTLDLSSPLKEWVPLLPLPPFEVNVNEASVLVSLRGCLYVLRASPSFGAVFNPNTRIWSKLEGPLPNFNSDRASFIASLGDSVGKILVYHDDIDGFSIVNSFIFLYDVVSHVWDSYPGQSLRDACLGNHHYILDMPLVLLEDDIPTLYFISHRGTFFAFDCNSMTLSQAPVLGFQEAALGAALQYDHSCASFIHFGGDLFCLCCSTYHPTDHGDYTWFHYVFLRVNKPRHRSTPFGAYVIGCLEDSIEGDFTHRGAFFI